jgi:3-phenylpropionate/trans-cinnamate dioxygenase ferredoxin subunit
VWSIVADELLPLAKTDDVPLGEVRVFSANGLDVAVANVGGEFYAIDDLCTHDGGPLGEGALFGDQVECPSCRCGPTRWWWKTA